MNLFSCLGMRVDWSNRWTTQKQNALIQKGRLEYNLNINQSLFFCEAPIHNKSHLTTISKSRGTKAYSLINSLTATQPFPHGQALGNSGEK